MEFKKYICDYQYQGSKWCIEIMATSHEDAEARLRALSNGTVAGEVHLTISVPVGWAAKAWNWLRLSLIFASKTHLLISL